MTTDVNPYQPPQASLEHQAPPDDPGVHLNPWTSMWLQPRATIRQIIREDPEKSLILLAGLAGISNAWDRASSNSLGDQFPFLGVIAFGVIVGFLAGLLSLYIGAALIRWTGEWFGGHGTVENLRAAVAWAKVPTLWIFPLWLIEIAVIRQELFTTATPRMDANPSLAYMLFGLGVIEIIAVVWGFVLMVKTVGEVQGFSAWKALGNLVVAVLIPVLLIVGFVLAVR
jgi:hypothetical protein